MTKRKTIDIKKGLPKRKIDSYFKKQCVEEVSSTNIEVPIRNIQDDSPSSFYPVTCQAKNKDSAPAKTQERKDDDDVINVERILNVERDPGVRKMMWEHTDRADAVRRAYILLGRYRVTSFRTVTKGRKFIAPWYDQFPDWLEYSNVTKVAYCFPCFLFRRRISSKGVKIVKTRSDVENKPRSDVAFQYLQQHLSVHFLL